MIESMKKNPAWNVGVKQLESEFDASRLQADLCRLAVFDQSFQLLTVGFNELLQHRAVILHQKLLFGHFHPTFQQTDVLKDAVQGCWAEKENWV